MYQSLEVVIYPKYFKEAFSNEEQQIIADIKESYGENIKIAKENDAHMKYIFQSKTSNLEEILYFLKSVGGRIGLSLYINERYEKTDYNKAPAFLLFFNKEHYDYEDDVDDENERELEYIPYEVLCDSCCALNFYRDRIYVKPTGSMKKDFKNKYTGTSSFDFSYMSVVSEPLYEYLVSKGVDKELFKDVYQKNGNRWAKCLDASKNILASETVECSVCGNETICNKCGRKFYDCEGMEANSGIWAEIDKCDEILNYGHFPKPEIWTIDEDIISELPAFSLTGDYFYRRRWLVVNKEVFNLIQEKVPSVIKRSIPVFAR